MINGSIYQFKYFLMVIVFYTERTAGNRNGWSPDSRPIKKFKLKMSQQNTAFFCKTFRGDSKNLGNC